MDDRRTIVRHVDGRIMIGRIPIKPFIVVFFLSLGVLVMTINAYKYFQKPYIFLVGVIIIGGIVMMFSEINNRETGLELLKSYLRYQIEGDLFYERGNKLNETIGIRCTWNKIKKRGADF